MTELITEWFNLFAPYNVPDDVVGFGFIVLFILCFNCILAIFKRIFMGRD